MESAPDQKGPMQSPGLVQLKSQLAGMSYDDQIAAIQPPCPVQFETTDTANEAPDETATDEDKAVLDAGENGSLEFGIWPADPFWDASFVWFEDDAVSTLFMHMIVKWLKADEEVVNVAELGQPFPWVGLFRAHALSPHEKDPHYDIKMRFAKVARKMADHVGGKETLAQKYRRELVEEAHKRATSGKHYVLGSQQAFDNAQKSHYEATGRNYTSCLDFAENTANTVGAQEDELDKPYSHNPTVIKGIYPGEEKNKREIPNFEKTWHPIENNSTKRPLPGDILVLSNPKNINSFQHVSFMRSIIKESDKDELWISDDGGAAIAGEGKRYYEQATCKLYLVKSSERTYQAPIYWLKGWLDVEQMALGKQKKPSK